MIGERIATLVCGLAQNDGDGGAGRGNLGRGEILRKQIGDEFCII